MFCCADGLRLFDFPFLPLRLTGREDGEDCLTIGERLRDLPLFPAPLGGLAEGLRLGSFPQNTRGETLALGWAFTYATVSASSLKPTLRVCGVGERVRTSDLKLLGANGGGALVIKPVPRLSPFARGLVIGLLLTGLLPGLAPTGVTTPVFASGIGLGGRATGLLDRDGFCRPLPGDLRDAADAARTGLLERWPTGRSLGGGVRGALALGMLPTPSP